MILVMVIKFGKIELQDWAHSLCFGCGPNNETVESWYRRSDNLSASIFLYATKDPIIWEMKCWHGLDFLSEFHDLMVVGSLEEAQKYVDNFLINMNRYKAFF